MTIEILNMPRGADATRVAAKGSAKKRDGAVGAGSVPTLRKPKLGEQIARQIIDEINALGWKAGEVLGTERELLGRYKISRATFREAVRQVERHGAATMRRGAGGGLIVNSPPREAAVRAMVTFLELTRVSFGEQHEVREQLDLMAVRLGSERMTPESAAEMMAVIDSFTPDFNVEENVAWNMRARVAVAQSSLNPALPPFIETLNGVLRDILKVLRVDGSTFSRDRDMSVRFKHELIQAMVRGDSAEAERLVMSDTRRRLLATTSRAIDSRPDAEHPSQLDVVPDWWDTQNAELKLGARAAFAIVNEMEKAGWEVGYNLGNEAALQKQFSVSRAVLREAIRQLELHGIARVKSGVGGGLLIGRADSGYTEEVVADYLRSTKIGMQHLWEIQSALTIFATEKLALMASAEDKEALLSAVEYLKGGTASDFLARSRALHTEMSDRTGNRAFALFMRILLRYGSKVFPPIEQANVRWLVQTHEATVLAICAHDVTAARTEMSKLFMQSRIWIGLKN